MLVIRRRAGESFRIGDDVEVEILELAAGHVKIGIKAPKEVRVLRTEVVRTQQENLAAAELLSKSAVVSALIGTLSNKSKP